MEEEKDAFYVVRKGDVIGIYKTLDDCQAQAGFSVCNPSVTVYKGYGLPKDAEEYLASHGLKNSIYSVSASDVKEDLFGKLVPCPFQQPAPYGGTKSKKVSPPKRLKEEAFGSTSVSRAPQQKQLKLDNCVVTQAISSNCSSSPSHLSIQLMDNFIEKPEAFAVSMDPNFAAYLHNDFLPNFHGKKELHGIALQRNKSKYAGLDELSAACQAMEDVQLVNGLECRIACSSYKITYVLDTEDIFYRRKRRSSSRARSSYHNQARIQRFHRFSKPSSPEKLPKVPVEGYPEM